MIGGIVEIAEDGRSLTIHRGFLIVSDQGEELGRVPVDDITALILSARQTMISRTVIDRLSSNKAIIVSCGTDYHPQALTWPCHAHHQQAGILHDQIAASKPLQKRLWQTVIKAKIRSQGAALALCHPDHPKITAILALAKQVKSGDPENREAQAARLYWQALMGEDFRRNRQGDAPNNFLNYGYAILRAATARAVCGAGLHPSLGIHHQNRRNNFALVDDLMEPFRPMVDQHVYGLALAGETELTPAIKRELAALLQRDMYGPQGASPLMNCLLVLAQSLVSSFASAKVNLTLAEMTPAGSIL